ncbi:MAG: hypothetical protein HY683_04290 [Chloroflexi bacterium]|nr:hypothetical protein [Chloroflexota bacterium]
MAQGTQPVLLRPYQAEVGRAVLDSVLRHRGLTFTVEVARQGGKNELSAHLELLLLALHAAVGGNLVKAAPTFVPQALISLRRLQERFADAGLGHAWQREAGHILRLGRARQVFLSAEPTANVVGNTAHILLEADEAQDIGREKFTKEFRPMGAATNVTTVLYGTPWDTATLLEETKQANLELEQRDGVRRHFSFDWQAVARHSPPYGDYVERERQRLGEEHPLFRTQYRLLPLAGGGGLFTPSQRAQLQGEHLRLHTAAPGRVYVAAVDVGGEAPEGGPGRDSMLRQAQPRRDSTVVTIGELNFSLCDELRPEPAVRVAEHYWWTGQPFYQLFPQMADLFRRVWRCRRVVVDATGLGAGLASMLGKALGGTVVPFVFTAQSKSRLGFELLAAVNAGRLQMYAADGSAEYQEFWGQAERAGARFLAGQRMDFFVDPMCGHDDFLMSLALLVKAAEYLPRMAQGRVSD